MQTPTTTATHDILNDITNPVVTYSTFWQRFAAALIDGIILLPVALLDSYNKTSWKAYPILIISFLVTIAYKPFLEFRYGATLGKMAIRLTIVTTTYQKAGIKPILLRNIFDIGSRLLLGIVTVITFVSPGFKDVNSQAGYNNLSNAETGSLWVTLGMSLLIVIDGIFLIADWRRQALHDKIAQTLVIQK